MLLNRYSPLQRFVEYSLLVPFFWPLYGLSLFDYGCSLPFGILTCFAAESELLRIFTCCFLFNFWFVPQMYIFSFTEYSNIARISLSNPSYIWIIWPILKCWYRCIKHLLINYTLHFLFSFCGYHQLSFSWNVINL